MASSFLQRSRHGTRYFFRRRVPHDVQHVVKLKQIFRSLATADRRKAIIRARSMAAYTDRVFAEIRVATNKKKQADTPQFDYTFEVARDEFGLPRLKFQSDPNDTIADRERGFTDFSALTGKILEARVSVVT